MDTSTPSHNFLHTFCIRPNLSFNTQEDGEEVILVLRAHPITQIHWLLNGVILLIILLVGLQFTSSFLTPVQAFFLLVFGVSVIFAYIWFNIIGWIFNLGIVTSKRIIDIDFSGVIYREITETGISKIQDITEKSGGFLESFVDFGDVFVQTAGQNQNIEFENVPNPSAVMKLINSLILNP